MTTKTLNGAYSGAYGLSAPITTLIINSYSDLAAGITATATGTYTLDNAGQIQGATYAIDLAGNGVISNAGLLESTSTIAGAGVALAGGSLFNAVDAAIEGYSGVDFLGKAGTLINDGEIIGTGPIGVDLAAGGLVINGGTAATGALIKGKYGVSAGLAATLRNFGTIVGTGTSGVGGYLKGGGLVINGSPGDLTATIYGVTGVQAEGLATVINYGTVRAGLTGGGLLLFAGGAITNGSATDTTALISGGVGVDIFTDPGTVTNFATIGGAVATHGVALAAGGLVTNGTTTDTVALIEGYDAVVIGTIAATVRNFGTIEGGGGRAAFSIQAGVYLGGAATVTNGGTSNLTALIEGADGVFDKTGSATVVNYATIEGTAEGIALLAGGTVTNGSALDTTALIKGATGVDVEGFAPRVTNFGTILAGSVNGCVGVDVLSPGAFTNGSATDATAVVAGQVALILASQGLGTNWGALDAHGGGDGAVVDYHSVLINEAGAIVSGFIGVILGDYATLTNFGTVAGFGAVDSTYSNALIRAEAGSVFQGNVSVGGGTFDVVGGVTSLTGLEANGLVEGAGTISLDGGASVFGTGISLMAAEIETAGTATTVGVTTNLTDSKVWRQNAGTLTVATGDRINFLAAGDDFSGTLTGAGVIAFAGGTDTLNGTTLSASAMLVSGGAVTLSGAINLSKTLTVTSPNLTIAAGGATLSGGGILYLNTAATSAVIGASAAATLTNKDVIEGAGQLGDGQLTIVNAAGGIIAGFLTTGLTINTGAGSLSNAGLIENTNTGGTTITGAVSNTGTLLVSKGTLTVDGAVSGAGIVKIAGGTADFASTFTENVTFTGTTGVLELAHSQTYTGSITGLSTAIGGSTLDLLDITFAGGTTKATFSGTATSGTLTVTDGTHTAKITLIGNYVGHTFTTASDGHGGTTVADPAPSGTGHVIPLTPLVTAMAGFGGATAASMPTAAPWTLPVLTLATSHVSTA